jgi:TolB-like protein/AraC-like DNA-binding protein/Tfp pilus assembly protein PilF
MQDPNFIKKDFLNATTKVVIDNMSDERFGVSELAAEVGMSRSNLLRKIKKLTGLSVSQFIRQLRLKEAMEMLRKESVTVSEVSYAVGFGSTSYFIKCFHDEYGYPPGEVSNNDLGIKDTIDQVTVERKKETEHGSFMTFWRELKRRKVVKVIIIYASISFIVLQVLDILIEPLFLPQWVMTLVIVLLGIGFPIAVVFSWIFDLTPAGLEVTQSIENEKHKPKSDVNHKKGIWNTALIGLLLIAVGILAYPKIFSSKSKGNTLELEKSIAVLPFKNNSNDSANIYFVNGVMESVLNNLQQIEDLRVISRTSVEKYRNNTISIPEIAKDLNVSYFIEGSGQKIGDEILLNIQLIEAASDKRLWAQQYKRDARDIFALQQEVAKNIADRIEVTLSPEEIARIEKIPTNDLTAYDFFLRGRNLLFDGNRESLMESIPYFKKAIEHDDEFALAYADLAITYFFLDAPQAEKSYSEQIREYSDKAIMLDPKSPQSLISKAVYYMNLEEYEMSLPYLEKALEYNPNEAFVVNTLSDFYARIMPDTEKYLEYALKGIQLNIAANDSITTSYIYLHLSNALVQNGFVPEAERYINKSITYSPENLSAEYLKAYIVYAKNGNLEETKDLLIQTYNKDLSRLDILQEIGKICYFMRDYQESYSYYSKFNELKEAQNLDIFSWEDSKISFVYRNMGFEEEAENYLSKYSEFVKGDDSLYKELSLAMYFAYKGETDLAIEHIELFSEEDNYHYWTILFLEIDPVVDQLKDLPEFKQIVEKIKNKFWKNHDQIKESLAEKGLL